jgi:Carboxypeptidase regulatory-like domain
VPPRQIVFLVVLSLCVIAPIHGQSPNGMISGIVVDPSGAAIVGAEILIANDATGVQYPAKTNGDGFYLATNLPPGTYRLQVSNSGFKTIIKPDIIIHVEDALAINFTLPIGAASEIVTVEGGAPLINTENASVGAVIDRNFVESLPLTLNIG